MKKFLLIALLIAVNWKDAEQASSSPSIDALNKKIREHFGNQAVHRDDVMVEKTRNVSVDYKSLHSALIPLSRLCAAISLKVQLHNKSITPEDMVAQMLNLYQDEDVQNVQKIAEFDGEDVIQLIDKYRKNPLPSKWRDFEARLMIQKGWYDKFMKINNKDIPGQLEPYMKLAGDFYKNYPDVSFLYDVNGKMQTSEMYLTLFKDRTASTSETTLIQYLISLEQNLRKLSMIPKKLPELLTKLKSHEDLLKDDVLQTSLFELLDLLKDYATDRDKVVKKDTIRSDYFKFVEKLELLTPKVHEMEKTIGMMEKILTKHPFRNLSWTPGLVGGVEDLWDMEPTVDDTILKLWLPEHYDPFLMADEVWELRCLPRGFEEIHDAIRGFSTGVRNQEMFGDLLKLQYLCEATDKSFAMDIEEITDDAKAPPTPGTGFKKDADAFVANINTIRTSLPAAISKLKDLANVPELQNFEELCGLYKLITFSADPALHDSELSGIIDKVDGFQKMAQLQAALSTLKPWFVGVERLLNNGDLKSAADFIAKAKPQLETFVKHPETERLFQYFRWIMYAFSREHRNVEDLRKMMELVDKLQNGANFRKDFVKMTDAFEKISKKMNNTLQDARLMNELWTEMVFKLYTEDSLFVESAEMFGKAVKVLYADFKYLESFERLAKLIKHVPAVETIIEASPDKDELQKKWGNFTEFALNLLNVYEQLEKSVDWMTVGPGDTVLPRAWDLKTFTKRLIYLNDLPNISIDVKPQIEVLKRIDLKNLPGGRKILKILEVMGSLDLNFASSNKTVFEKAPDAVDVLLEAFEIPPFKDLEVESDHNWKTIKPDPKNRTDNASNQTSAEKSQKAEAASEAWGWRTWTLVVFLFFMIPCLVMLAYACYKEKYGRRRVSRSRKFR